MHSPNRSNISRKIILRIRSLWNKTESIYTCVSLFMKSSLTVFLCSFASPIFYYLNCESHHEWNGTMRRAKRNTKMIGMRNAQTIAYVYTYKYRLVSIYLVSSLTLFPIFVSISLDMREYVLYSNKSSNEPWNQNGFIGDTFLYHCFCNIFALKMAYKIKSNVNKKSTHREWWEVTTHKAVWKMKINSGQSGKWESVAALITHTHTNERKREKN